MAGADDLPNDLAENLRRVRIERGLTQAALAKVAGTTRTNIASFELGRTANPGVFTLYPVALALGCPLEELMGVSRIEASTKATVRRRNGPYEA